MSKDKKNETIGRHYNRMHDKWVKAQRRGESKSSAVVDSSDLTESVFGGLNPASFLFIPKEKVPTTLAGFIFLCYLVQTIDAETPTADTNQTLTANITAYPKLDRIPDYYSFTGSKKPTPVIKLQLFFKHEEIIRILEKQPNFKKIPFLRVDPELIKLFKSFPKKLKETYINVFAQQFVWIKEIFSDQLLEYFDQDSIKQVLSADFLLYWFTKDNLIRYTTNKPPRDPKPLGILATTRMDNTMYITFEVSATQEELLKSLVLSMYDLIEQNKVKRLIGKSKLTDKPYPFVNKQGQIDQNLFASFKSAIKQGTYIINRIPALLTAEDKQLSVEDLQLKNTLLELAADYQPCLHIRPQAVVAKAKTEHPEMQIIAELQMDGMDINKYKVVTPETDAASKLMAIYQDFHLLQGEINPQSYSNEYNLFNTYAKYIDLQFKDSDLKRFLFKEYQQFMVNFHKRPELHAEESTSLRLG